jgi:hypothetical protein
MISFKYNEDCVNEEGCEGCVRCFSIATGLLSPSTAQDVLTVPV